jgi:hypothetical protein
VNCAERGQLLQKIWNRYLQLFEHILKVRENERDQYNQSKILLSLFSSLFFSASSTPHSDLPKEIQEHQIMYQQLYKDKDQKFSKMYLQLAAEKEKISMAKDKLAFSTQRSTALAFFP